MMNERFLSAGMAPQQPPVPEIEGFLKKLKRKTSNLSGSWNKRWFFVDIKRREFGYSKSKAPGAPKSSIYLNDITAVVQFDDTHFQVESRTRNFFLCGDSKASTTCWVKSLDEYRKKMSEYEKEKTKYDAAIAAAASQLTVDAQVAFSSGAIEAAAVGQMAAKSVQGAAENRKTGNNKAPTAPTPSSDEPSRDSFSSSSSMASSSSSSSSSSSPPSNSKRTSRAAEKQPRMERRTPSPTENPSLAAAKEKRSSRDREASSPHKPERRSEKSDRHHERERGDERECDRIRERDRECGREHEKDRSRERERDRERDSRNRPINAPPSRSNSRQFENRSIGDSSSVRAHPGKGYVMQAWVDDDI